MSKDRRRARSVRRSVLGDLAVKQGQDLDGRLGLARFARSALNYIFPDHWSFLFGEIALYSFLILVVTGVYLAFFFVNSDTHVIYHGAYAPLRGRAMSEAFQSMLYISFQLRAGLVMRQVHHWAALVFLGAIGIHLCRIFFTGAFRKPREINWVIGLSLLLLAIMNGFFGYSLPDDMISGTGLRIAYSITESIPLVGTWLALSLWGGPFPGTAIIAHMWVLHVFVLPLLILALLGAHLTIIVRQHHTQFRRRGAEEGNVVGTPLWPAYAAKSSGFFFLTFGVLCGLGGLVQINPIWLYGPYESYQVGTFAQPDWFVGWLEGSLRLGPAWELHLPGHLIPVVFWPGVFLPVACFGLMFLWPFLEAWVTRDHAMHHLLDRPRDRPVRTAVGAAALAFFLVLLVAGGDDVIAVTFGFQIEKLVWALRILSFTLPVLVGASTWLLCRELSAAPDPGPRLIGLTAGGGYRLEDAEAARPEHDRPAPVEEATPSRARSAAHDGADDRPHRQEVGP